MTPTTPATPATSATSATTPSTSSPTATTAAGEEPPLTALQWVTANGATATPEQLTERFAPSFLSQLTIDQLTAVLKQVGVVTLDNAAAIGATRATGVGTAADGTKLTMQVAVEATPPHRITELLYTPRTAAEPPPTSMTAAKDRLAKVGSARALLVANIDTAGKITTIETVGDPAAAMPLGSIFKLWVLITLAEEITAGSISWDEQLVITDALKSIPSGELQDLPTGTKVTVRDAAEKMIQISDNTATDLLINRLTRKRVEQTIRTYTNDPATLLRTLPLLTTREMALLKLTGKADLVAQYEQSNEADRRKILADTIAKTELRLTDIKSDDGGGLTKPVAVDTIEWFASPADLVDVHLRLDELSQQPQLEQLRTILAFPAPKQPGVVAINSKGGSEPGVLALSYLIVRTDGTRTAVIVAAYDTAALLPDDELASITQGILSLVQPSS
jgi:beta-lactamase class A